jgi:hypothetical protein
MWENTLREQYAAARPAGVHTCRARQSFRAAPDEVGAYVSKRISMLKEALWNSRCAHQSGGRDIASDVEDVIHLSTKRIGL